MGSPAPLRAVPTTRIRVFVVDDNDGFRASLCSLLEDEGLDVVGQASSGAEAIEQVGNVAPDVVLMDLRMPEMDGIEATRRVKEMLPSMGVVALTGADEQRSVRDMLVAGASGYVLKDSDSDEIVHAIRLASTGGAVLSPEVTPSVIDELTEALDRERRRARQLEVAQQALLERSAHRQQLVGRLGHELRTPVTVILGLAQTIRRSPHQGLALDEALDTLIARAEGLARLVRRFEAAVEAGLTERADVTSLAYEVAGRDPRIVVEASPGPVMATLNRTAGLRVLEELVENALAFSSTDQLVTIKVDADGGRPEVRVIDQGPGVDPDAAGRIFEPLEQAEELNTRTHQGVGLGLSLARLSARSMEGDVVLEDGTSGATTFLWIVSGADRVPNLGPPTPAPPPARAPAT